MLTYRARRARREDAPTMGLLPLVQATDEGYVVGAQTFVERKDALNSLLDDDSFREVVEAKPHPEDLAEPRWFDAAAVEEKASAYDGSQFTETKLDEQIRNLNAEKTAIPIDGGNVSAPHESVYNSAAPAAGWAYAAVKVVEADGRAHMWLYGQAIPAVDEQIDAKKLQFGSIAWSDNNIHRYDGNPIGSRLESYALTNAPFIEGLTPHPSREFVALRNRGVYITGRSTVEKGSPMGGKTKTSARGPAKDLLMQIAEVVKVDLAALDDNKLWEIEDQIRALFNAAKVEDLTEGGTAPAPADGDRTNGARVLEGFESQEQQDAVTEQLIMWLGTLFGEMTPAELVEQATAHTEAFQAAVSGEGEGDGGEGDGEGERTDDEDDPEDPARTRSMRKLSDRIESLEAKNKELEEEKFAREVNDHITACVAGKVDVVPDDDRKRYLKTARRERDAGEDWKTYIDDVCGKRAAPPKGVVMDDKSDKSARAAGAAGDFKTVLREVTAELKAEHPEWSRRQLRVEAHKKATQLCPKDSD